MADISNIIVSAEGVDTVCKIKDKVARNDIALNRTTLGTQCKNLLKNNAVTQTINGVTFTVNSDGSVAVNGTNTSSSSAYIQLCGLVNYGNSKLIASIGQNITDVYMAIYDSDWNWIGTGSAGTISWENSSKKRLVRLVVKPGATINNVTVYPMIRYADITDDTYEEYHETVDERILENKSDIVINKTTLGYQRKNLFDWKNANVDNSSNATYTKTDTDITVTSTGAWGRVAYKLPALEIGTKYTFSAAVSDLSQASATARIRISYNSEGTNKIVDVNLTKDGEYKAEFTPTESTIYVLFYPNFSSTAYTNSFTASDIMLRYADILDDTYEPYQPSVREQINNFGTQQQLLCDYSSAATSSVTIQITGLFSNYSAVICTVKYYLGTTSITLPLKYIKSIGKSKEYSPVLDLGFRYVDDNNLLIGGADAAISSVKIISLY